MEEDVEDAYLPAIFDEVAEQMRSDLRMARFALQHPGLKGSSFENTFRKFLRQYLPKNLDVSTGVLVNELNRAFQNMLSVRRLQKSATSPRRALLMFYVMISTFLTQARMPDFRLGAYVQGVGWIDPTIL